MDVKHEGWLSKKGPSGKGFWRKRYFVLTDGIASYYTDNKKTMKKGRVLFIAGEILLKNVTDISQKDAKQLQITTIR